MLETPWPGHSPPRSRREWIAIGLFVLLVMIPLVAVAIGSIAPFQPARGFLESELRATGGKVAQLFWTQTGMFSEAESSVAYLHTHPGEFERIRFPLPNKRLEWLRFDPLDGAGEVVIRQMRVVDVQGRTIREIDPLVLTPMYQIAQIQPDGRDLRIVTAPGANDPMVIFQALWVMDRPHWLSAALTPFSLAGIAISAFAALGAGVLLVARDVLTGPLRARHLAWFAALFAVIVAAKLHLLHGYPMPIPFWDQWDGELATLYKPLPHGALTWRQMFTFHNEHRIFFSRMLAIVLLAVNGQWDPALQIVVNIFLHAATTVVFAATLWLACGRRWLEWIVVALALAVAPPFALENTLAGFQSAFYFLILVSLLALWLMTRDRVGSLSWVVGWFCSFAAVFTVAGGVLIVPVIGCFIVLRTLGDLRWWRQALANLIALASVAAVGYSALPPPIPAHAFLKAASVGAFLRAFARNLAFPWITSPRLSLLMWLPLGVLAVMVLVRRFRVGRIEPYLLSLGAWVVLQAAAVAYSRGANGAVPASRYLDMLSFGFVVNTMALLVVVNNWRPSGRAPLAGWGVLAVWMLAGAAGVTAVSGNTLARDGEERARWMSASARNLHEFIARHDVAAFLEKRGPQELPYYNAAKLAYWLDDPEVQPILPSALRKPLPLAAKPVSGPTFAPVSSGVDLAPVWDSFAGGESAATARFESEPIQCTQFHYLRFEIAGAPGSAGLDLSVKRSADGRETRVVSPLGSGSGWRPVSVRCPDGPFTVLATDTSTTSSFGFRSPTEIAGPSAWAESLIERSWLSGAVAMILALLATGLTVRDRSNLDL
jgi:hypothetical protein